MASLASGGDRPSPAALSPSLMEAPAVASTPILELGDNMMFEKPGGTDTIIDAMMESPLDKPFKMDSTFDSPRIQILNPPETNVHIVHTLTYIYT